LSARCTIASVLPRQSETSMPYFFLKASMTGVESSATSDV
jgi:hypothetical protein